jgi:hypothetical protein
VPGATTEDGARTLDTRVVLPMESAPPANAGLRPLGMLELPELSVNGLRLSQLSGLAWDQDEQILYAISDKGALFHLRPLWRDGNLTGVRLLRAVALKEKNGKALKEPRADSEGLDIRKGRNGKKADAELIISFERVPRIARYRPDGTLLGELTLPAPLDERGHYRRGNKALESVCVDDSREGGRSGLLPSRGTVPSLEGGGTTPRRAEVGQRKERLPRAASGDGRDAGGRATQGAVAGTAADDKLGILTLPEEPLINERAGFNRIFRVEGGSWPLPLLGQFQPSAMECLGNGRVLILERDFGTFTGRAAALRRATLPGDGRNGASAKMETLALLDAAEGWQIDNFEGLAHHQDNRFFTVSDNNDLFVQRTLLFYFELAER